MITQEDREARDKRLEEKMGRLRTFGLNFDPLMATAITLDSLLTMLTDKGIIDKVDFEDARLDMLEKAVDDVLAQIAKPKLHVVK